MAVFTGTYTASTNQTDYEPARAGDGIIGTGSRWATSATGNTHWIKLDAGTAQVATSYTIGSGLFTIGQEPTAWTFDGSTDNSSWTTLDTRSITSSTATKHYAISNTTAYRYYRLNITAIQNSADICSLSEFQVAGGTTHMSFENVSGTVATYSNGTPASVTVHSDGTPYNMGQIFLSTVAGDVTHLRYYEPSGLSGTVTLRLYGAAGAVLASTTHTAVSSSSGWRNVALSSPYTITANTEYMAAMRLPGGWFARSGYSTQNLDLWWGPVKHPAVGNCTYGGASTQGRLGFDDAVPSGYFGDSTYAVGVVFEEPAPAVSVAAPVLASVFAMPTPTVVVPSYDVAAPVLASTSALLVPTISTVTPVSVAAPVLAATMAMPVPTVVTADAVSVAAPVLALTAAMPSPTISQVSLGVIEVDVDCSVDVGPLAIEIGGATGVEDVFTVSIDCSVEVTPYVLLRPVAPVALVINEWPIERHAHLMPALSAANPRYSGGIDYVIERETIGRHHVFVGGVDVTYKDNCPAFFDDWTSSAPMWSESARIAMPQMKPWDDPGSGSWSMFAEDAPVEIALVRPDDTVEHLWEGFLAVEGDTSNQSSEDYTFTADGLLMQAAHELHDPLIVMPATDYGHLVADVLNSVTHRRWSKIPRFTTGFTTLYRGEQSQTKWQYAQDLLARCFHDDGRQLTLVRVAPYTYRIQWKKAADAAADWTVTKGAPGVAVSLERNHAARVDAIYGRGYAPDGGFWCGRVFPGLDAGVPPPYPGAGFTDLDVGVTDAMTTTGNGVSTWQRKMRELGYPVTVDGVMNSADTRWVLAIQRASGSLVDGDLGPQTWAATWENNSTAGDFTSYRLPLATRSVVEPHLYAANGAIIGANPDDDTSVVRHAIEVDFKTNITKATATALAQAMLARLSDVGYQGTITLQTDPHEAGSTRFDIKPGDNVHVVGHHGGVTVQVSEVSASGLEVRLTVDSLARDAEIVANLLDRAEEARRDLAGRTGGSDASRQNNARTVPYESESKAGRIARTAINGNAGLWTIRKAFVSQVGVAKIEFETSPRAESVVTLFNRPITANRIAALVPDPLADSSGWYDAVETLKESYGCMEVFGTPENSGGYWPRQEGEGSLTGKQRDSASTLYDSPYGGFVWVAMFTSRSCWAEGTVFPAVPN